MSLEIFEEILFSAEEHFEKALNALDHDFNRIRTGRAAPQMLDHVQILAFGTLVPLKQMASITVPEPTQLLIKPYDRNSLRDIEKGLINAELGMAPQNDGNVIRLNVPSLTEERRKQLAAQAKEACEKSKVARRNSRRDAIKQVETKGKELKAGEDAIKEASEKITNLLHDYEAKAETALKGKTTDILKI